MSDSTRARLDVQKLDDRTVPSVVSATSTVRPLDFVATGTFTTTNVNTSGPVALTGTSTTNVTVNGLIDYGSPTNGSASLVTISGTGTGNEVSVNPADGGGRGSFAQTVQGQFSIQDSNGAITTPQSLTGTVNWLTPTGSAGIDLIGPQPLAGTFDTATYKMSMGWSSATNVGNIAVTLAEKQNAPTDLAFTGSSAVLGLDGAISLDFSMAITGNLMRAASHDSAATTITAVWEGDGGRTLAADLNVALYWNTGTANVRTEGLAAPEWAKRLVVKLDAGGLVSEGNENNNSWVVNLSDLLPPPPPPPPLPTVANFLIVPGSQPQLQWVAANGQILGQSPAIEGFNGPVHIATGDVNGDGVIDAAIGAGTGGGPRVRVVDGRTGVDLVNFFAYDPEFRGGAHVALGNVSGDSKLELITGAGEGGGPHVRIFNPLTGDTIREFFAFDEESRTGVAVAAGDLNDDGRADVIVTPGQGAERVLLVLNGSTGAELFRTTAGDPPTDAALNLNAGVDPISGVVVVTLTPDDGSPIVKFRGQLASVEPLLTPVSTLPVLFLDPVAI